MRQSSSFVHWKVRAFLDANLQFNSYLLRGLSDLQDAGRLTLTFGLGMQSPTAFLGRGYSVMILEIETSTGKRFRLAYDPRDQNNEICENSLAVSDLYYKVNFNRKYILEAGSDAVRKVLPAGLFFPVRPFSSAKLFQKSFLFALFAVFTPGHFRSLEGEFTRRSIRTGITRIKQIPRKHWNNYYERKDPDGYEKYRFVVPHPRYVFFNPRAWDGDELHRHLSSIKLAQILRFLRQTLGDDFHGGFRPLEYARQQFPDLLFSDNSHSSYIENVGKSDVVVSTRGMWDCFAFKLPEYLAAGRCILGEEFENELPSPMIDGKHIMFYKSDLSDLPEKARMLHSDPSLCAYIAKNAAEYYDQHVRPVNAVRRMLDVATSRLS